MKFSMMRARDFVLAAAAMVAVATSAVAEDIDLYAGTEGTSGSANVLFFIDNTSNWSANNQAWNKSTSQAGCNTLLKDEEKTLCLKLVNDVFGNESSLVQGRVQLRALRLVLTELVCNDKPNRLAANVGIMLLNEAGTADQANKLSGYIRHRVAPLDANRCAAILADLADIDSKIQTPAFQGPSSADYGSALYEAYKYFGGWTNPAGAATGTAGSPTGATGFGPQRYSTKLDLEDPLAFVDSGRTTYKSPLADALCGNNYIVLVGNQWPNQEFGTNFPNNNSDPTNTLLTRLSFNPGAQIYPKPLNNNAKSDVRFADEWARFLFDTDVSDQPGVQNLRMFTVDVFNQTNSNSPDRGKQAELLKSIAKQTGEGGYFAVNGNLYDLVKAFTDILTQIASIDSVFASASLPVSVNAQGTFLNQVFMGVFRPDAKRQQRWAGNLKQYQFQLQPDKTLALVDAVGKLAVDEQNTGFIRHCATSFWSSDSDNYWDSVGGVNASGCTDVGTKPYSDAPDGPIVERGGAAHRLRLLGHASRNIRTCTDLNCTDLTDFSGSIGSLSSDLVKWVRGENVGDGTFNWETASSSSITYSQNGKAATATRPSVHGAVVHSRPLAVNYGTGDTNDVVVFYGADDGMLRAISGNQTASDGTELWAFVAPEHWSKLDRVRTNSPLIAYPNLPPALVTPDPTPKSWFFDGAIGGYQERTSGAISKIYIYATMRRGGDAVYAFDVTKKPGKNANQPTLLWRYSAANDARMGQSWSMPVAFRVRIGGADKTLVAFGAGYDSCEDADNPATACASTNKGRGIVIADAAEGPNANYRFIGTNSGEGLDNSAGRFVADITPVDVNFDGYVDALYAVDTRGNVWRINTSNPTTLEGKAINTWDVNRIATVSDWSVAKERRKFMYAPSTVVLGRQVTVLVGTGDREKPSSSSAAAKVNNRFYGIRDDISVTSNITPIVGYGDVSSGQDLADLKNVTDLSPIDPTALASFRGWFRNLSTTAEPYEQVVTTPLTLAGVTYFSTFQAKSSAGSTTCRNLGTARSYQIDFQTGTKLANLPLTTTFISQGIPPSPVGGVVLIDGQRVPFLVGGPAPTPLSPSKVLPKVKADRKPVYRFQRIDN